MKTLLSVFSLTCVLMFGAGCGNQTEKDSAALQGTWVAADAEGMTAREKGDFVGKLKFTFSGKNLTVVTGYGKRVENGTYVLDTGKKPARIELIAKLGHGDTDERALGIYRLKGDKFYLCLRDGAGQSPGGYFPTEFKTDLEARIANLTFHREKP